MDDLELKRKVFSRNPATINTKREYKSLHIEGHLGNRPKTWNNYKELKNSNYKGRVSIRSLRPSLAESPYKVPLKKVPEKLRRLQEQKIPLDTIYFNESMDDKKLIIQGEIMRSPEYVHLHYTTIKKPMKEAFGEYHKKLHQIQDLNLNENKKATLIKKLKEETGILEGIGAIEKLKQTMDPYSYDDLQLLLTTFPDSVIEFSTWEYNIGNLPGRNTIFWEVRNY